MGSDEKSIRSSCVGDNIRNDEEIRGRWFHSEQQPLMGWRVKEEGY